ncbi:MAG: hypothetical protein FJX77_16240, partial [Armatimonadetes bacterium]|nr:hypothetical protein [Armatimonadota bacterium]
MARVQRPGWLLGSLAGLAWSTALLLHYWQQPVGLTRILPDGTRIQLLGASGPVGTEVFVGSRLEAQIHRILPQEARAPRPAAARSGFSSELPPDVLYRALPLLLPQTPSLNLSFYPPRGVLQNSKVVGYRTTADSGGLTLWIRITPPARPASPSGGPQTRGRNRNSRLTQPGFLAVVGDDFGTVGVAMPIASRGVTGSEPRLLAYWTPWFPRRGQPIRIRLVPDVSPGSQAVAEFRVRNPFPPSQAQWTPQPLPARGTTSGFPVVLEKLTLTTAPTTTQMPAGERLLQTRLDVVLRREGSDQEAHQWEALTCTFQDAAGSGTARLAPAWLSGYPSERQVGDGRIRLRYSFPGEAFRGERAIRIRVEFSRARAARPVRPARTELLTLRSRRLLRQSASDLAGLLIPFGSSPGTSRIHLLELEEGQRIALLEVRDLQGKAIPFRLE